MIQYIRHKRSSIILSCALLATLILLVGYNYYSSAHKRVQNFSFETVFTEKPRNYALHNFSGKVIILNFWASWCAPCIEEFPILLDIAAEKSDEVILLFLSSDHDRVAMDRFLTKMSETKNVNAENILIAHDPLSSITQGMFEIRSLPQTFIINKNLTLHTKLIGNEWKKTDLLNLINILHEK